MSKRVKVSRSFTFKAYECEKGQEVLNNAHIGKFLSKSECHYYCEKDVLDFVKSNMDESKFYLIYKISTIEDTNIEDMLIEQIFVKEGEIHII